MTGVISFQSKGLSRVFSNTTVRKHQFFSAQLFHSPALTPTHDCLIRPVTHPSPWPCTLCMDPHFCTHVPFLTWRRLGAEQVPRTRPQVLGDGSASPLSWISTPTVFPGITLVPICTQPSSGCPPEPGGPETKSHGLTKKGSWLSSPSCSPDLRCLAPKSFHNLAPSLSTDSVGVLTF